MIDSTGKREPLFQSKVAIIIVNWNGKKDTLECLESVRRLDYPCIEIVVVDNGSSDDSVAAIRERFPDVVLLESEKNLGTAGGRNIGIRYVLKSGSDFVLFLDNDTILDSQLILNLIKSVDVVGRHVILGAKIYYFDDPNKIWYAGSKWKYHSFIHLGMGDTDDGQKFNSIIETAYACGCAMFTDKTVLEKIGFFDEKYFAYFEETDFCYRARAAGFRSFLVPSAKVWHKISSSTGGKASPFFHYYLNRNILLWAERHLPLREKINLYLNMLGKLVRAMVPPGIGSATTEKKIRFPWASELLRNYLEECNRKYKDPAIRAKLIGVRDYFLRRFGNCPESIMSLRK